MAHYDSYERFQLVDRIEAVKLVQKPTIEYAETHVSAHIGTNKSGFVFTRKVFMKVLVSKTGQK